MKIASAPLPPASRPVAPKPSTASPTPAAEDKVEIGRFAAENPTVRQTDGIRRPDEAGRLAGLAATSLLGLAGSALNEPLRMLLIGPPGSGKGTQAEIVDRFFDVPHISTGQILRQEIKQQTELGKAAEPYVKAGQMVPDSIMLPMVDKRLEQEESFILDGFPRSTAQAEHLDATLSRLNKPLTSVANLQVSDDTVVKRLKERGREDDTEEVIRARLKVYHEQSEPVIAHYQQQSLLDQIPAEGKVPEVGFQLIMQLNRRLAE